MSRTRVSIAAAVAVVAGSTAGFLIRPEVRAADHGDSPQVRVDPRTDLNDFYVFTSPETPTNTVFVITCAPAAGIITTPQFAPGVKYQFAVDTNDDKKEDQVFSFVFGKPNKDGVQTYTLTGPKRLRVRGSTESTDVAVLGSGKCYAGLRDDPFFFDLIGFRRGLQFSPETSRNFFFGLNTTAIVLEVPTSSFGATAIGAWARTVKGRKQIDRNGRPAINTVLIPAAKKDKFNSGSPRNDVRDFTADAVATLKTLGNSDEQAAGLAAFLLPDILTLDTAQPSAFPNGRGLSDDVIDIELGLLSQGALTTDHTPDDNTFLAVFPYLGVKN